ncbi:hypothetical protein CPC08DRAFT_824122 [Agrocybe pediades]|nr:hypothetical protein CPC08DRAFT_824122 [Agrocybe pediades]
MATASGNSSFGQTLQFITDIKLQEVEKQRLAYQEYAKVLDTARTLGEKGDILGKIEVLVNAVKSWPGSGSLDSTQTVGGKLQLQNLEFWLEQARHDPGMRFGAAKLFGNLFNEWLASGDSVAVSYVRKGNGGDGDGEVEGEGDGFENVGRKELHEQKERFTSLVFDDYPVDAKALEAYLRDLFSSEEAAKALDILRKELQGFGQELQREVMTVDEVRIVIKGVISSGLVDEEKKGTLKAFLENPIVLEELASVLTMRMASLDTWSWPKEGLPLEFRRHLNGKYRAFTDPDIIDALLLHYIGVSWQVQMKESFLRVFGSKAWKFPPRPSGETYEKVQAQVQIGPNTSINAEREKNQRDIFFMAQLQDELAQSKPYDDDQDEDGNPSDKAAIDLSTIKQKLLHIMTTERYLNEAVHGSFAALCSDFEWFGPSLPHRSILTVLEFMGTPKVWLNFFQAFLSMPLRLPGEPGAAPRIRRRGTPINYALSVVCGEAIIFVMDFAVNQRSEALFLYRMHDDLWLWDADVNKVAKGWEEMNKYAGLVGLKFNEQKTGSTYFGPDLDPAPGLPVGPIRWGFLVFDTTLARFVIDQSEIDKHIVEMRRQLANTKSIFGWVNVYNKYMAFFLRNVGGLPANCFGHAQVAEVISTLGKVQRELFADGSGSAVGYLRKVIGERFGIAGEDLPEGYFYFPIGSGGLEVRNTVLEVLALSVDGKPLSSWDPKHEERDLGPNEHFQVHATAAEQRFRLRAEVYDRKEYAALKETWEEAARSSTGGYSYAADKRRKQPFMSFEEYIGLRESWLGGWGHTYRYMLDMPAVRGTVLVPSVRAALAVSSSATGRRAPPPSGRGSRGIRGSVRAHGRGGRGNVGARGGNGADWDTMGWYQQWVVSMYGEEVVKKFGGLEAVDPNLIPVGMVQLFRGSRMKLDQ